VKSKRLQLIPYLFILAQCCDLFGVCGGACPLRFRPVLYPLGCDQRTGVCGCGQLYSIFTSSSFWETTQRTLVYVLTVVPLPMS